MKKSKDRVGTTVGYGWCGRWRSGDEELKELGWLLSRFIAPGYREPINEEQEKALDLKDFEYGSSPMYRVKVTIAPVLDKRGRYILRCPK